jgi:4-hydroxyacetophenone monooxygenase
VEGIAAPQTPDDVRSPADGTDEAPLWDALQVGNIPVLLMILAQLTGDMTWLAAPYAPTRTRGMDDNDTGGLPADLQAEVRAAAFRAILEARRRGTTPKAPDESVMATMMSACMGEPVPAEYSAMMLEELGLRPREPEWEQVPDAARLAAFQVLIVGAGVSGLCAAIILQRLGIRYMVIEKNESVGGTWLENDYPGCGVDTPSHLYSYSFAPNNWSRYFARRDEIRDYIERCADEYGVRDNILLGTAVEQARFDVASGLWTVRARRATGEPVELSGNLLVSAVGQLNQPAVPSIPGADRFRGKVVHSARWTPDIDVHDQRVGVIGTGASAMQIVPTIADEAARVIVFQRSPQWAVPSGNYQRSVPDGVRYLMEHVPLYAAWYRCRLVWSFSDKVHESLQINREWPDQAHSINAINDGHRRYFTRYLTEQLGSRQDLLGRMLPQYPPFAKRMLIDNSWFATMTRDDVELVAEGIREIVADGVIDNSGVHHAADILVYATGFQTLRLVGSYDVYGRDGQTLRDSWGEDDAFAYLGMTVPGFPNFFCLYGPNTSLGHGGSLIFLTECSVRYIARLAQRMILEDIVTLECREDVCARYNRDVDAAHSTMIWSHPGATNWYRNARGRVVTNSPWRVVDYWRMTYEPDLADFVVRRHADADGPSELC